VPLLFFRRDGDRLGSTIVSSAIFLVSPRFPLILWTSELVPRPLGLNKYCAEKMRPGSHYPFEGIMANFGQLDDSDFGLQSDSKASQYLRAHILSEHEDILGTGPILVHQHQSVPVIYRRPAPGLPLPAQAVQ